MDDATDSSGPVSAGADSLVDDDDPAAALAAADEALIKEAKEFIQFVSEAEQDIRKNYVDDLKFLAGEHWPENVKQERENDGRPCLTINRLPQSVQQVTNDQRQNRPSIRISPRDSQASDDVADLIEGLVRDIQNNSNAEVAFDTAFDGAAGPGLGYFRLLTDYVSPESFDQEVIFARIRNPLCVFFDPYSQKLDGSDAERAAMTDDLSKSAYERKYPESKLASPDTGSEVLGNEESDWIQKDGGIRVAEYIYKEYVEKTLYLLGTGETAEKEDLVARISAAQAAGLDGRVVKTKVAKVPKVKWIKFNAIEILERGELPGSYIPIVPVYGQEIFLNGKRILKGIVRDAKDAQRMYDYWASAETEAIALAPKAPWIGVEGQFEGHEDKWETANRKNHAYLEVKSVDLEGKPAALPQRSTAEPAVQAITQARQMSADDLKATTGVYEAGQGAQGNETSGIAIQRRTTQIGTANFHLVDNLRHSMRHAGRIMVEWIPSLYDTPRALRIIGEDGSQKIVHVNTDTKDDQGKSIIYSFDQGRYDVSVDIGPSFASKRQEAAASMMDFSRAVPDAAKFIADLIAKNQDWPGSQDIADRLHKLLPPQLQDDGKQPQLPPQAMALMQQQHQMINGLQGKLNELTKIIETKKLELEHKERVEVWNIQFQEKKLQVEAETNMAKLGSEQAIALLTQEIGAIKHESALQNERLKLLASNQPIGAPDDFNASDADGGNYPDEGHVGSGPTGGQSPGQPVGQNP